jgi:outer membrane protein W
VTISRRWKLMAALLAVLACGTLAAAAARADDDPWNVGSNWMFVRAGFARSSADGAGNAGAGYGIGFRHVLKPSRVNEWKVIGIKPLGFLHWTFFKDWSVGGFVEYNVLGRYGSAADIEVPAAIEMTRYIKWKSAAKPYVTLGVGPHYRKMYNTGSDFSIVRTSGFVATGFDAPVTSNQMLGFDVRLARVQSENKPVNPVFGSGAFESSHWSLKLTYSIVY